MTRVRELDAVRLVAGLVAVLAAAALPAGVAGSAGAAGPTVAVARFYAPSPVATYPDVVPEEYLASNLSTVLASAGAGRVTVVPQDKVRAAESALRWQEADALRFARLQALAHAAGADRVVVGQIRQFALDTAGGGGGRDFELGGGTGGMMTGLAVVLYQIFDAASGRIVYQTQVPGHSVGTITGLAAAGALDDADRHAAVQLLGPLSATP
jgi:hypothetical protein